MHIFLNDTVCTTVQRPGNTVSLTFYHMLVAAGHFLCILFCFWLMFFTCLDCFCLLLWWGGVGVLLFFIFLREKKVLLSKNLSKIILLNFPILYFLFICCLFYCKLGQNIIYNNHLNICFLPIFKTTSNNLKSVIQN